MQFSFKPTNSGMEENNNTIDQLFSTLEIFAHANIIGEFRGVLVTKIKNVTIWNRKKWSVRRRQ